MVIIIVDRSTIKVTLQRRSRANESLLYRQAKRIYRVQNERGWQSSAAIRLNWTHMCTAKRRENEGSSNSSREVKTVNYVLMLISIKKNTGAYKVSTERKHGMNINNSGSHGWHIQHFLL